jgi:hypothetical protein
MTIAELLLSQPRWGHKRCTKFLADIGMTETKTIGSMTERQRKALAALLGAPPDQVLGAGRDQKVAEGPEETVLDGDEANLWDELASVTHRRTELSAELEILTARRDDLIRSLSKAGATRRSVATAASLTVGRVQQVIDLHRHAGRAMPNSDPTGMA